MPIQGKWVDSAYKKGMKIRKLKFAGDEYFKLLQDRKDLKAFFALGEKIIICLDDKTAVEIE